MCLSATLTPNIITYIYQVCKLETPIIHYDLSIKWDNINLIIVEKYEISFQQLQWLIPDDIQGHLQISKMIIFHDNIDNLIRLVMFLSTLLSNQLSGHSPDIIVVVYYDSIDVERKDKIQADFEAGWIWILICIDAFDLDINIKNIRVVI